MNASRAVCLSCLLCVTACEDRGGDLTLLPRETFLLALIQAACEEQLACSDPADQWVTSVERCVRFDGAGVDHDVRAWYDIDGAHYDATAAQACLQWLADRRPRCASAHYPGKWNTAASPCAAVFGRWRKPGQVCQGHSECSEGRCHWPAPCAKPVCLPALPTGAPCSWSNECGYGMQCGANGRCRPYREPVAHEACDPDESCGPDATCVAAGICWPLASKGQPCGGEPGLKSPACSKGLQCSSAKSGWCKQALAAGDACDTKKLCPKDLVCADKICARPAADGEPCSKDRVNCTGADRACRPGPAGKPICAPLPEAHAPCLAGALAKKPAVRCAYGLYCDPATQLCRPWSGPNQPCAAEHECRSDTECFQGKCVRDIAIGAACPTKYPWLCAKDAWCNAGLCAARSGLGGPCDPMYWASCRAGLRCEGAACVPQSQAGDTCASWDDCADGLECNGLVCIADPCAP